MRPALQLQVAELRLASGRRCTLGEPDVPGLTGYYVLAVADRGQRPALRSWTSSRCSRTESAGSWPARRSATPSVTACSTTPHARAASRGPQFHILLAASTSQKRRAFALLQLKHVLRWFGRRRRGTADWAESGPDKR
jgi:hypothetical protein